MGGATVALSAVNRPGEAGAGVRAAAVSHVVYRRSGSGRRVSKAVKLRNANLVFDSPTAAATKLHPGDRSKIVPITISHATFLAWFGQGAHAVDLRAFYGRRPTVASIAAASGPAGGGTAVALSGENFEIGAAVKIGTANAAGEQASSFDTLSANTPALPPGTLHDVVVTNPNGLSGSLRNGWLADFTDVPRSHLFHNAVEKIFRAGITSGCGLGNYCPDAPVTRAQMAVFLLKGKHGRSYRPPPQTGNVFNDVPLGTFLGNWIERLAAEGITKGCAGGNYCPDDPVTREAMAVFLLRAKHGSSWHPRTALGTVFNDVPPGPFADWIEQLADERITSGCGGGNYCPGQPVTRGQMAVFLAKTFGLTTAPDGRSPVEEARARGRSRASRSARRSGRARTAQPIGSELPDPFAVAAST